MKRAVPVFICFCCVAVLTASCRKTKCISNSSALNVTDKARQMVPYTDSSILTFKYNGSNTPLVYKVSSIITDYGKSTYMDANGCVIDVNLQGVTWKFKQEGVENYLNVALGYYDKGNEGIVITFDNIIYSSQIEKLGDPYEYDSMEVRGIMHYHVSRFSNEVNSAQVRACYYNATSGILKLEVADGNVLELAKKE